VHELVAREDAVRVRGEEPEQVELAGREADGLAVAPRLVPRGVDDQRAELDPLARRRPFERTRRRTVFTRVASSRGENGFVT
jgi:hypothetical protein